MIRESKIRARYSETDQMGIVHHSEYVKWFEVARTDFLRDFNYSFVEIEDKGFYLPVIGVDVHYKSPAKYDDEIIIQTSISQYNGVRIKFHYIALHAEDKRVIVEGHTEHCWTSKSMHPVKLKKLWPELDKILVDNMEG
ncbi:acyl-CoA thioester hydrolase [Pullulanibacillus pueri]|uniref:4-hydroxybenzoyl-CoA thioesterase n=1 Tax=Pullulanibacillus pueri TaxID=1437324 RepID=A0A8J2ZYI1_9BACL|nr:thioesterase family protein [Pullulanibacillus pueri]MBM7683477.1 acyl-CoA thioester hydrolase [Pullulanibacillus pueri]GGH86751.1 4-hydroxybenzoyl-CoA thioesterase [Pullulanibacillus pueri]